jgi:hypothetical protein
MPIVKPVYESCKNVFEPQNDQNKELRENERKKEAVDKRMRSGQDFTESPS